MEAGNVSTYASSSPLIQLSKGKKITVKNVINIPNQLPKLLNAVHGCICSVTGEYRNIFFQTPTFSKSKLFLPHHIP